MKYVVTVSGVGLAAENEILRFCSGRGFGMPEIAEDCSADRPMMMSNPPSEGAHARTRREIVMTVVSGCGDSFIGGASGAAKWIARITGRGVSAAHMMSMFRRGEKFRGCSAIITKDSKRNRKDRYVELKEGGAMKDIDSIFPRDMRVETRTDNFDRPCGYDVVGTRQGEPGVFPECVDRVCMMPDGIGHLDG